MFLNRVVQRREGQSIFAGLPTETMRCAEISGNYWLKTQKWAAGESFSYPDHDICVDVFREADGAMRSFDMIIADQVWEHLERPYAATRHVFQMLAPGGYFYVAAPFFARYHAYPVDCSRWSARGLANLLVEAGFDASQIRSDQWGNLAAARRDCARRWAKHLADDDLTNDPDFPVVAWALARKMG